MRQVIYVNLGPYQKAGRKQSQFRQGNFTWELSRSTCFVSHVVLQENGEPRRNLQFLLHIELLSLCVPMDLSSGGWFSYSDKSQCSSPDVLTCGGISKTPFEGGKRHFHLWFRASPFSSLVIRISWCVLFTAICLIPSEPGNRMWRREHSPLVSGCWGQGNCANFTWKAYRCTWRANKRLLSTMWRGAVLWSDPLGQSDTQVF